VFDSPAVTGSASTDVNAPVLVLSGTDDQYVPFADQQNYVEALQSAGKTVERHPYQSGRHTLILDPADGTDARARAIDFLHRYLGS
jgi:dipeptidyl aminopeptidase/acylaminoacyl peptidase